MALTGMRTLAVLTATLTALAGLVVAGPAAALNAVVTTLYSGTITVHTANGQAWQFGLRDNPSGDGSTSELGETILRSPSKPVPSTEDHEWAVTIPQSSLTFDTGTGDGSLKTPHSVASLTTLDLTFTTTSRRNTSCTSGSQTVYFGNLTGRVTLHTQLRAGGTVGAQHATFTRGKTEVIADSGCVRKATSGGCYKGMYYLADGPGLRSLWGVWDRNGFAQLSHDVALKTPASASRTDQFSTNSSRAPVFNARKHTLQVWAAASGPFTGTGRFTGGTLSKSAGACTVKGVTHTEQYRTYSGATFRNGANHPMVAHTSLVGKLGIPKNNHTTYEFETWS